MTKETSSNKPQKNQWYLTKSNYYSKDADSRFMSFSQYKRFAACEAEAMAELDGTWTPKRDQTPLLVGNYLHSYFESKQAHQTFIAEHPEIIAASGRTKGQLKKPYKDADGMIATLKDDKQFQQLYKGHKEVMVTGSIEDVKFMGKLDSIWTSHALLLDLKTTQDLHKKYWLTDESRWGSFLEAYNYPLQMAIYQELSYQRWGIKPQPVIIAVTKQDVPDKVAIEIPQDAMDVALQQMKDALPHIQAVKAGTEPPRRCERCEYCRATKNLEVVDMDQLID